MKTGPIQKAILAHLLKDKAGLIFEGLRSPLEGYTWKQIDLSLQALLDRGSLARIEGTQHCYRIVK